MGGAAVFGVGASGAQRAAAAGGAEDSVVGAGQCAGDPGGAGDGSGLFVEGEVVNGEPAGHGRAQRGGFDDGGVPGGGQGGAGIATAIGAVGQHLQGARLGVLAE